MRLIFDLESDGLLDTVTQVWCIGIRDLDTGKGMLYAPGQIKEALGVLKKATYLAGHNVISYDFPVLEKLYNFKHSAEIFDTIVASRTVWPDLMARDVVFREKLKKQGFTFPNEMLGSHALKAWGWRLGNRKSFYEDWTKYTEEMGTYCLQDCSTTHTLYNKIKEKGFSEKAIQCEHELHAELNKQADRGILFNTIAASRLYSEIQQKRDDILVDVQAVFPPKIIQLKTKTKVIPFNPSSRDQIAKALIGFGWKPKKMTEGKIPKPVINEATLESAVEKLSKNVPAVALLGDYLMLSKRVGQLATGKNAWLKLEQNGVMHGRMNHMGCVTSRCSHHNPNLGQVPATHSPYGNDCRALFYVPDNYTLMGSDLSGLELRMLGHYMARYDDGAYADIVINGDIHTINQKAAGLPTRDNAKTFIYAWLYGAGPGKIGSIIGKGEREGKAMIKKFLDSLPALKKLKEGVAKASARGYIVSLDGRYIPVRSPHAALNTLLQGAGAVVAKYWYLGIAREFQEQKLDASIRLFVHDETQSQVYDKDIDAALLIPQQVLTVVEHDLKVRVPLACECKTGKTWFETH